MNEKILYVRVMGMLVPVSQVSLVQVSPNNHRQVVQEIPLSRPLEDLMEYNLNSFVKVHNDRFEWLQEMNGESDTWRSERG
jgi:hypothetical protein